MKTEKELKEIKEQVEAVSKKLNELTEEELAEVTGGAFNPEEKDYIGYYVDYIHPAAR